MTIRKRASQGLNSTSTGRKGLFLGFKVTLASHWTGAFVPQYKLKIRRMGMIMTCLLRNLYAGQEATVRTRHGTTDWFQIGKAVRQGCILSPCLFNLYAEYIKALVCVSYDILQCWIQSLRVKVLKGKTQKKKTKGKILKDDLWLLVAALTNIEL